MLKGRLVICDEDHLEFEALIGEAAICSTDDPGVVADAEILLASPRLAARAFHRMPSLRWIQSTWAGVDALVGAGIPESVTVTGVKGVFGVPMREFVFGHLLAHTQRIVDRAAARSWDYTPPARLEGSRLGILGTGSIGSELARTGKGLGLEVVGCSRSGALVDGFDTVFAVGDRFEFAADLDHLVCVLPGTPETAAIVDEALLGCLRPGATFINAGRGVNADLVAVTKALASGRLSLAVLDVLPVEPLPEGDPLWQVPGLVITSHTAAWSRPSDIARVFVENLGRWRAGRPFGGVIDLERGY